MFEAIAFYVFGTLCLCAFLIVVMSNNILYALTALAFGMILVSGLFFLLNADFLGVVQITVYTGAVVVMYAFGMMLFDVQREVKEKFQNQFAIWLIVSIVAIALLIVLGNTEIIESRNQDLSTNALAHVLFKEYLVCFEAAAVMLLMAMIAGIGVGSHKAQIHENTDEKQTKNNEILRKEA